VTVQAPVTGGGLDVVVELDTGGLDGGRLDEVLDAGEEGGGEAVPPSAVLIALYSAGFFTMLVSHGVAAPCPENVLGTHEYLSV
jgi:hypothetical protein